MRKLYLAKFLDFNLLTHCFSGETSSPACKSTRPFILKDKISLLILGLFTSAMLSAQVTVPPATGGTNVSADKAANAASPAFTTLTNIQLPEAADGDIGTDVTELVLTAPSGWTFNNGGVTVNGTGGDIVVAGPILYTPTTITIPLTVATVSNLDLISINNVQVRSADGALLPNTGNITLTYTGTVNGLATPSNVAPLSQQAGDISQLFITAQPGNTVYGSLIGTSTIITQDQFGTPTANGLAANLNVTAAIVSGTGTLAGTTTQNIGTAGGNGTVSFAALSASAAGNKTVSYSAPGLAIATSGSFTIDQAPLTIVAGDQGKSYGTTFALGTSLFTPTGLVNSETIGAVTLLSTGSVNTADVGTFPIVPSAATGGTFTASNYDIIYTNGTLTVDAVPLAITAGDQSKAFGATLALGTTAFTPTGLMNGETIGAVILNSAGAINTANVGTFPIVASGASGGTFTAANYTITYNDGTLTVGAVPLTITAGDQSKAFGTTLALGTTAFTSTGLMNGETIGSVVLNSAGAINTANVGTFPIVASGASGGTFTAANYTITYNDGTLTVGAVPLTITAGDQSKAFGATLALGTTAFTSTGLMNGETIGSVVLNSAGAINTANVGTFPIVASGASGGTFSAANYTITYNDGTLTVGAVPLTITAGDQSKTFGTTLALGTTAFSSTGLMNGETIGSVVLNSAGAINTANVGTFPIVASGASGGTFTAANYTITYNDGTLTVGAVPLTITAGDQSKTFGTTLALGTTAFSSTGLMNGETIGSVVLNSAGAINTANVGTFPIVASGASGGTFTAANYTITYNDGTLTVGAVPLTITAGDQSKTFGTTLALGTTAFSSTGLMNGETIGSVVLNSAGAINTANVGTFPIVASGASGGTFTAANYTITYNDGTLTVGAVPLTITAGDQSKAFGATLALGTTAFTSTGLMNGETIGSVVLNSAGAINTANVGTFPIVASGASGGTFTAANYTITYVDGTLTVGASPLTITASPQSKAFGTTLALGTTAFTATGLLNGETIGAVTLTSAGAINTANAGTYSITPSAATGGTFVATNYTITYTDGTLTVGTAPLTITASAQSKTFGATLALGTTAFTSTGLQNGNTIGGVTLTSAGAAAIANVGTYPITPSAATGGSFIASNYTITYVDGTLTVGAAPLTITASPQSKAYGTTLALGTTAFTSTGLQNGNTIGGVTLTSAGAASGAAVGTYPIIPSAATGGSFVASNYIITYTDGTLTVGKSPLTITASAQSKTFGTNLTLGTTAFTATGLLNGETIGGVTLASAGAINTANVGTYPITPSAATGGSFIAANYTITYTNGTLTVSTAPLTITANPQSKTFGATLALGTTAFTPTGLQNGNTIAGVTLASAGAVSTAAVGTYPITPSAATGGGFTASNYTITYTSGTLTVGPAPLTITASAQTKPYGATLALGTTAFTATGLVSGNTVTGVTLTSPGAINTAAVGTYPITPSAPTGGGGFNTTNYTITYTNGVLTVTKAAPAIAVTSNNNPACFGTSITFTATITPGPTAVTGTVQFFDGSLLGTGTVAGNVATFTTSALSATSHNITATYSGDANYNSNTSPALVQTINALPVTTGVTICQGGTGSLTSSAACATGNTTTVGPKLAGTGTSGVGGGTTWSNPTRVIADDNSYATNSISRNSSSDPLNATGFGFAIPAGANIDGIQVSIGRYATNSSTISDNYVKLIKAGTVVGSDLGAAGSWSTTTSTVVNYGATNNLWGTTWTPADINNGNFGVSLLVDNSSSSSRTASVDYIQVTITYTIPGTLNWYTVSSGGTSIGLNSPFNPVGVAGSGLANTNTPGTTTFYAACAATPGCRTAADFVINPLPTITGALNTCIGGTTQLTGSGTANVSTPWVSATPSVATVNSTGLVTGVAGGTTVITYKNNNGCIITATITVELPTITGTLTICNNGTTQLIGSGSANATTPWTSSNTGVATVNNTGLVTAVASGTTIITYRNAIGCTRTATVTVLAAVNYGTVASGDQTICYGASPGTIAFSTAPSGGANITYRWYYQNGLVNCPSGTSVGPWVIITGTNGDNPTYVSGNLTGSRTFAVMVDDDCGVPTWADNCRKITVLPDVVYGTVASGNEAMCPGGDPAPITLSAPPSGGAGTFTYQWWYRDGLNCPSSSSTTGWTNVGSANGGQTDTYDPPAGLTISRTYALRVDATGSPDCDVPTWSNSCRQVTIYALPTITTDASADDVCSITTIQTTPLAYSATTQSPTTYSITWSPTPANSFLPVTDAPLPAGTINISVPANTAAGTYTGSITVKNANGCVSTATTFTVTVKGAPVGTLIATEASGLANNDNIICIGSTVTFTATFGFGSYIFKVNGTQVQSGTSNIYSSPTLPNGASVTVDVANAANCGTTFGPIVITVNPLPTPSLIADMTTICKGDLVTFTATGGTSYTFKVNGAPVQISAAGTYETDELNNSDVVTVEATNANGCKDASAGITMIVNPPPAGTLGASASEICSGGPVTFTATSLSGVTYEFLVNGLSVQNGASNIYNTTFTDPSVVTVRVTNSTTGCAKFWDTLAINVNTLPSGILTATENSGTANDNSICAGTPVNFTATPGFISYEFSVNGGVVLTSGSNTYSNSTLANNDEVTVKVSNGAGCEATFAGITITVAASPVGTLAVSPSAIICVGDNATFTATSGYTNYTFKIGTNIEQNGAGNTFSTTSLLNGDIVTVDVTNANTCVTTFNPITITANPLPTATLMAVENSGNTANDGTTCTGATITFTAPVGFANYNFLLNGISVQNGAANIFVRSNLVTGNKVEVAVSNANNCIALSNAITVTVNPLPPVAPITGTLNVCVGKTVTLADITSGGAWTSLSTGIATIDAGGVVTGVAGGAAIITYSVSNANGCDSTVTATVTVNALPTVAAIAGPAGVCIGSTITLTDATAGGTWSSSDDLTASVSSTGVVSGVASGSVTITYSVTNGNGCTTEVTKLITVNALPVLTAITGVTGLCVNTTSTLSSTPAGGVWTSDNKPVATVNASTGVVTAVSAGTTNITYTVTNGSGCVSSVSIAVTVNPLPVPTLTGKNPICLNDDEIYTTEAGQTGYLWNVVGGDIMAGGGSLDNTIEVHWTAPGTKSITVNYTNSFGCTAATSSTFTNAPSSPPPTFLTGVSAACLNSTGNVYSTESGKTDYAWTVTGGAITSGGTDADDNVTVTWNSAGPKSVSINYSDASHCNAVAATVYPVTVNPLPTAIITGDATVCQGSTSPNIIFEGAGGTSPYTFTYKLNGVAQLPIVSTDDFATIPVPTTTAGVFIYELLNVEDASSTTCSQAVTGTATVTVSTTPGATISYTGGPFCTSASPVSVVQTGTPGGTYSALPAGLTLAANGTITPATSTGGIYTVTYTVAAVGGCSVYTTTTGVTITTAPTAAISYAGGPFCTSSAAVAVTRTGTAGGNYTSTAGLDIDGTTGAITPATSTNGTYTVTYTIPAADGCALFSTTTSVIITSAPGATISYAGSPFCTNAAVGNVLVTGTAGGTFSSTTGLTINGTTGAITASASTAGTYVVTYSIGGTGGCANFTTTTSVTITTAPTAVSNDILTCADAGAVSITTGASATNQTGIVWSTNGTGTIANPTSLTTATFTPSAADIAAGSRTITLTANGNAGCSAATSTKTITINALPAAFIITPASASICLDDVQPLTATTNTSTTGTQTISSGTVNVAIPDATTFLFIFTIPGTVTTNMAVSTIPAGAIINSMTVNFTVNHGNDNDLVLNLKAPNGNVINLVDNRGGSGNNFTNTIITSVTGATPVNSGTAPFTGTYAPDAHNATGTPASNAALFSSLFGTPNGTWTFGAEDDNRNNSGTIVSWSLTFNYTVPNSPLAVTWSPVTGLYTDAGGTTPYAGQGLSTVYSKPASAGPITYTAATTNASNCSTSQNVTVTVNPKPVVTIAADYCAVSGKVRLTASSVPVATSYIWSTGATTATIDVDIAGSFDVTAFGAGTCPGTATINVANELVVNGDFEAGNLGFTSPPLGANQYTYVADGPATNELNPEGLYGVGPDAHTYHTNFWGHDHTTGTGNFMIINGFPNGNPQPIAWQETVTVLPNTTYYFSAWGISLNSSGPFARLQFNVNGTQVGTAPTLPAGTNSNSNSGWTRFYGTWTSGPTVTTAVISITDLQNAAGGNDFGLDDITFGTLSNFITLESAAGTDAQTVCRTTPITDIVYNVGNGSTSSPLITGLPAGVTAVFSGQIVTISGAPTAPGGTYSYSITTTGTCNPLSKSGTITVQAPKISLSAGNPSPKVCINTAVSIGFTISGTATGATATGLPAGVTGALSGSVYTISGTATVEGIYSYKIYTTGTCAPQDSIGGTITVQSQILTLSTIPASAAQTVCINSPLPVTIRYAVGGTANNASVSGLPPGVNGLFNGGFLNITGTPTSSAGSPYTYTVTTSGLSCDPTSITGTITVTPAATLTLTSAVGTDAQSACNNLPITNITYAVNGGTNASITSGTLPAGVSGSYAAGVFTISGTPTAGGTFNYTVTTTGGCGIGSITGSITVSAQTIVLTSGVASPTICANTLMGNILYTIGGTANDASVTGLPIGVTGALAGNVFTISGTPTDAAGAYPFTVTTSGPSCDPKSLSGTITVSPAAAGGTLTSLLACSSTSGSLTLSGHVGTITRWESSTDNGVTWSPITNITITQNYTTIAVPTQYRVVVSNSCGVVFSSVATVGLHNYWTGTVSSDWHNGANWSDGAEPILSCPDVTIPSGTPFPAVLGSGTASIINLIIKPSATVEVTGATLQIAGTVTSTGGLIAGNGTVVFNGGTPQTIAGSVFSSNNLMNLTMSNASGLSFASGAGNLLNISGVLSFGNVSNATLHTGDNIVLTSTATGTARVADVTNNGANTGNKFDGIVTVERYFPARRAWRFFTAPVSAGGNVFTNWQNGGTPIPGRGTYVTGSTAPAGGLDVSPLQNSSLKATAALTPVLITTAAGLSRNVADASDNIPYSIFVRGDRTPSNYNPANSNITTLSSKGKLQTGIQTFPADNTAQAFTFIGNPYASPVDLNKIQLNNVARRFFVWDPYLNLDQGAWVYLEDVGNTGTYSATPPTTMSEQALQSGQAFFVQTNLNGPASVVFQENQKSSVYNAMTFRPMGQKIPSFRVNFYHENGNDTTVLLDGVLVQFDNQFSKGIDLMDAVKASNIKEMLALKRDNKTLAVERRPVPTSEDTLYLQIKHTTQRNYRLVFEPANFDPTLTAYLVDNYTGKKIALSVTTNSVRDFSVNDDAASASVDRFSIVFKQTPVLHQTTRAYQLVSNIAVEWTIENEINISKYEVEKSADNEHYVKVATIDATGDDHSNTNYSWLDVNPASGDNFYRIRRVNPDGNAQYGSVVSVNMGKLTSGIRIYPNPVTNGIIGAEFKNMEAGIYASKLLNSSGQTILNKIINHAAGTSMEYITPDFHLPSGIYQLEVTSPDKKTMKVKVIIK